MEKSRKLYGDNKMTPREKKSFIRRFLSNLSDPIIKILLGALIINLLFAFHTSDWVECMGIGVSVFLATFISTMSEYTSENAFSRLEEEYSRGRSRVVRSGEVVEICVDDIVVGDVVCLSSGERIPADGSLIFGNIYIDQSAMTGESKEVLKRVRKGDDEDFSPSSPYFCHRGATVISGSAYMQVERVGDRTFLGGISREIQGDVRESPLKMRLSKLARQISTLGYIASVLVAVAFLFKTFVIDSAFDLEIMKYKVTNFQFLLDRLLKALTIGLTVIVVAVPEGLPMMIAVVLSSNIKKMIKSHVLVRKPVGIESAGSMNVLFTDKTGTLTCGKLGVGRIYMGDGRFCNGISDLKKQYRAVFEEYKINALMNTESKVGMTSGGVRGVVGGNSTDRAILDSVLTSETRAFTDRRDILNEKTLKDTGSLIYKIPFSSENKFSVACVHMEDDVTYVKGAYEKLLPYAKKYISDDGRILPISHTKIRKICESETKAGKRVLAVAKFIGRQPLSQMEKGIFPELVFVAIVVLEDFLRESAYSSVERLKMAGIDVVMITGDNADTAKNIARECGILSERKNIVLTSAELACMSDDELKEKLPEICVLARAVPQDKSRLVRVCQESGLVVGMTGDGVNDAPALRMADVGFAMGDGVQVAKDAGDIVILDNDLSSIANAVKYGRNVFKSIRKFITLQLMMNFCAVGVSMICPFLGIESPVTVVQMLWINVIMDTLGGLAFAGEPALDSCMEEPPKRMGEQIMNSYMINEIVFLGGFTIALYLFFLKNPRVTSLFRYEPNNLYLLTAFFALFIFSSVFNCFNARTDRLKLFAGLGKNRAFVFIMSAVLFIQILFVYLGGHVLRTLPLTCRELLITLAFSLLVFPAEMLRKCVLRLFGKKGGY